MDHKFEEFRDELDRQVWRRFEEFQDELDRRFWRREVINFSRLGNQWKALAPEIAVCSVEGDTTFGRIAWAESGAPINFIADYGLSFIC